MKTLNVGVMNWAAQAGLGLGKLSSQDKSRAAAELGADPSQLQVAIDECLTAADSSLSTSTYDRFATGLPDHAANPALNQLLAVDTQGAMATLGAANAYKPGPDLKLFRQSDYSEDDAIAAQAAFKLPSLGDAKAFIGEMVRNKSEYTLQLQGITPQPWDKHEMSAAFSRSAYSPADAQATLDAFSFLSTLDGAKEYIGLKVINGTEDILADIGVSQHPFDAHDEMAAFRTSGYSDADAQAAVKAFSFLDNIRDAKQYIGLKVINDYESMMHDAGITPQEWDKHELQDAFASSGYTAAEAAAVCDAFDFLDSIDGAKEYIGLKVINGSESLLSGIVDVRSDRDIVDFDQGGYSKVDAFAAMEAFGLPNLGEAKRFIAQAVRNGDEAKLADAGITPHAFDRHELASAFARSSYSEADAVQAVAAFDFLDNVEQAKEYIGLKIINGYEQMLDDNGISTTQFDRHDMLAAFAKSGYTSADAKAAVAAFDFLSDDKQAMEYIGLKIINDYEGMMADAGITPSVDAHEAATKFAACDFTDGDVLVISKYLQGSMDDARAFIGSMLAQGNDHVLAKALQSQAN